MNLSTPSSIELHRARFGEPDLDESDKVPREKHVINDGKIFLRSNGTPHLVAKKIATPLSPRNFNGRMLAVNSYSSATKNFGCEESPTERSDRVRMARNIMIQRFWRETFL